MLFPLAQDMQNNLQAINDNAKRKKYGLKIGKQFSRIVRFHCKLIQLSEFFSRNLLSIKQQMNATVMISDYFMITRTC